MHPDEYSNWARIKSVFEENGTTENTQSLSKIA